MKMFNRWLQSVRDYTGSSKLSLAGEIIISSKQLSQILMLQDVEKTLISKITAELRRQFSYLQIKEQHNVVETSIKFYTYEKFIAETQFLEKFRSALADCLCCLNETDRLKACVSVKGAILNTSFEQKFIFLSKESKVEYKIIDRKEVGNFNDISLHRIKVYGLAAIFGILILYNLYCLYAYIPDHDPSKLLHPVNLKSAKWKIDI
ncbi:MAG: hypothetical protein Q4E64_08720 [Phascolarctobacterium sp.]|uniref:hypothetical protein n=1 Tax=Phascolarctobacterium sp. TaxID=2049039 RepID=UPI0026DBA753|nr:hypothetical protein [Phascolarctobacterium sp.]MDO4921888.1 hypothetical protein [Phascolarctobacterium sp.]